VVIILELPPKPRPTPPALPLERGGTKDMIKIAIIQFPGLNCEYETRRAVNAAGMQGEFFRWNDDYSKLDNYDGYIIPGGFSYEDRVRSGMIASLDPLMAVIKSQAVKGKPVLGICNGAQIVLESGLVPGVTGEKLAAALAVNKRIQDGKVLGTGFYNTWVNIKNDVPKGRCAFNYNIEKEHRFRLPVAHGEGRFMMEESLLQELIQNGQTVWRYCDEQGQIKEDFPTNPNGAIYNLAAVCNPVGNVMAIMPHPERTADGQCIFESLREYISQKSKVKSQKLEYQPKEVSELSVYQPAPNSVEIFVDLIITDNEARTLDSAVKRLGYTDVDIKKKSHWEVELSQQPTANSRQLIKEIILSNELLNTSKEIAYVKFPAGLKKFNKDGSWSDIDQAEIVNQAANYLVKYKDDVIGQSKLGTLTERLGIKGVGRVTKRTLWQLTGPENKIQEVIQKNILANPYSQEIQKIITN